MPSFFYVHCPLSIARFRWFIVIVKELGEPAAADWGDEFLLLCLLTNG